MLRHLCLTSCLAAALLAVGCGFQSEEPAAEGGEFRFVTDSAIKTLDPQSASWLVDFRIIRCLYEPLLRVNGESGQIEPAVAKAMPTVSDDGRVYTFTIRDDAKWSNGDTITADDFLYGWKRAIFPDYAAQYAGLFFCIKGVEDFYAWRSEQLSALKNSGLTAEQAWKQANEHFDETVGIKALNDRTIEVTLKQPTAYFVELIAFATFSPMHEASTKPYVEFTAAGSINFDPKYFSDLKTFVTNGPYILARWEMRQRMILDQNPHYWDRVNMKNSRLVMHIIEDQNAMMLKYDHEKIDWLPRVNTTDSTGAQLAKSGRKDVHVTNAAGTYFYRFNCKPTVDGKPNPFSDPRVRRAFSLAVNRQELVDRVTQVGQPVARSFIPPGSIPGYRPPVEAGITFDPQAARDLLAEAGYPGGDGLSGLSILFNPEGGHGKPAQSIARMWRENLGVTVQLESLQRSTFGDRVRSGGYLICRSSWYGDYRDPTTFLDMFRTGDGQNDSKYSNPEFDALLNQAAETIDPEARMKLLREAEATLLNDQPFMPLYHYVTLQMFDPDRVKGINPDPWGITRLDRVSVERDDEQAN